MTPAETDKALHEMLPGLAPHPPDTAQHAAVEPSALRGRLLALRDKLGFEYMVFMTALDWQQKGQLELVYRLFSYQAHLSVVLRVSLPRDDAKVDTVSDIYRTAEWHERETAEMFGIEFTGHPDTRKLLLPDDIEGHPLRKDFSHPAMIRLPEVP
jgi:NADH:ubiquinone oxidoreductase subunit C